MTVWRSVAELRDVSNPAWPEVRGWISASPLAVDVIAGSKADRVRAVEAVQVTARSVLGAMLSECGAVTVDHGWLRLLGAGGDGLGSVRTMTDLLVGADEQLLVIAVDVLGGYFAINGGALPGDLGLVSYWGPDSLDWSPMGIGHAEFVASMLGGAVPAFYESLRWPGWESEVAPLRLTEGLSLYPFPFTREGHTVAHVSRRSVPLIELIDLYQDFAKQIAPMPDGQTISTKIEP